MLGPSETGSAGEDKPDHPVSGGPGRRRSTEFGCPNAEESATTAPVMVNAKLAKVQSAVFI
jgi:hypothetical protein